MSLSDQKLLNLNNLSSMVKNVQYAIQGEVAIRAKQIQSELDQGILKPFDKIIRTNIGDSHATGQKPITFFRQVMALCAYPELLQNEQFPADVKQRSIDFLDSLAGRSIGSYTDGTGSTLVKNQIAKFISERDDGIESNPDDIFVTSGASGGLKIMMEFLLNSPEEKRTGYMIPIPQFPFYSATISEFNSEQINYYLDESNNWGLSIQELERAYQDSLEKCQPKVIVIINPGNPTGQVLSLENIKEIIKWAFSRKLFILADEVYQDNIYTEQFHSFKKVAHDLGPPYSRMEMASFYSASKGYMGECGSRAGYFEVVNLDPLVKRELVKLTSMLCTPVLGQACLYTVVNPPRHGEPSYELFMNEKNEVLNDLKEKARLITDLLNKIEGVECNPVQGALYAFPRILIPEKAVEHARSNRIEPDMFYCLELINETGICVVPGSGFHQREGTYHFRTTILPPIDEIKSFLIRFEKFHTEFMKKWS